MTKKELVQLIESVVKKQLNEIYGTTDEFHKPDAIFKAGSKLYYYYMTPDKKAWFVTEDDPIKKRFDIPKTHQEHGFTGYFEMLHANNKTISDVEKLMKNSITKRVF